LERDGDPGLMVIMPGSEMSICSCFGFPSILAMFYSLPLLRLVLFHLSNETKRKVLRLLGKKIVAGQRCFAKLTFFSSN
jgi:hypothetical protein